MNIHEIIFSIISDSTQNWVRYWKSDGSAALSFEGEYIEIRSGYISSVILDKLIANGFKIETIKTQKINADAYSDITLKRALRFDKNQSICTDENCSNKYDFSKSCKCENSPGETWCCNNCGLPVSKDSELQTKITEK